MLAAQDYTTFTCDAQNNMGRQSTYTQAKADEICARLSTGEPLAQICRDEHMPETRTVYDWRREHPDFDTAIARAREDGYDEIAADCLTIADSGINDTYMTDDGERTNTDVIARSKLRVETRLKLLAKWDPKRYGDKIQTEHSGAVQIEAIERRIIDSNTEK